MKCLFEACDMAARALGLCPGHYQQQRHGRALTVLKAYASRPREAMPGVITGTALVPLTQGHVAIIDLVDAPMVSSRNWWAKIDLDCNSLYAMSNGTDGDRGSKFVSLHRFLWRQWGLPETPEIDHENLNGLDCRQSNLRAATHLQNAWNKAPGRNNTSGVRGVSWDAKCEKWFARIWTHGIPVFVGYFDDLSLASTAVAGARRNVHGEFARTGP